MTTIVLADKSNIIRYDLRSLLDVHADFRIIGEAAGGWEAIQLVGRLKPNILILDWGMARRGRMEVLRRAQQRSPSTQIILFSLDWNESQFLDADESRDVELVQMARHALRPGGYLVIGDSEKPVPGSPSENGCPISRSIRSAAGLISSSACVVPSASISRSICWALLPSRLT